MGRDFGPHTLTPFHHTHNAPIRNPIKLMLDDLIAHFCSLLVHVYKQSSIECVIHFCLTYANALLLKRERSNRPGGFWSVGFAAAASPVTPLVCRFDEDTMAFLMAPVWLVCPPRMIIARNLKMTENRWWSLKLRSEGLRQSQFFSFNHTADPATRLITFSCWNKLCNQ